jgi:hypothetical protein
MGGQWCSVQLSTGQHSNRSHGISSFLSATGNYELAILCNHPH